MPKVSESFNLSEYALVADRIASFYERYPTGRIITRLVSRDRDVTFKAAVYRSTDDSRPAATGWASEREGDGEVNLYACLENTETSAIGRALANLGFTASKKRPSREEMEKVERSRRRPLRIEHPAAIRAPVPPPQSPPAAAEPAVNDARTADLLALIDEAEAAGFPASRAAQLRDVINRTGVRDADHAGTLESQLRRWIRERKP